MYCIDNYSLFSNATIRDTIYRDTYRIAEPNIAICCDIVFFAIPTSTYNRPHFNHRPLHKCIWVLCVYIFSGRCWIVYVHKREYYIKIEKNKKIGWKLFINWCNIKGTLHTLLRFARESLNITEEMDLRLLLTCAMLRLLLNLINLNACFISFYCHRFFSVATTN